MRFLRSNRSRCLLALSALMLSLSGSTIRAAEDSTEQSFTDQDELDLAKIQSGGKVVFVSSGQRPAVFRVNDNDRRTIFEFSATDPRPTIILNVTDGKPVHRISVLLESESKKVDIYLLNELPRDSTNLDKINPVASIVDLVVGREASSEFAPQNARFVALRWTLSSTTAGPLKIAEISAFTKAESPNTGTLAALTAADPPIYLVSGPPVIPSVSP